MPIGLGTALWGVVLPLDETNIQVNPSWEYGTAGASVIQGATLGTTSQFQRYGAWALKVTPSNNGTSGAILGTWVSGIGTTYSVSVWAFVEQGVPMRFAVGDGNGLNLTSGSVTFTGGGTWQWYNTGIIEVSNTNRALVLQKTSGISQLSFYADGVMINPWTDSVDRVTTYFDGDTGGGTWLGAAHNSVSVRSGQYRGGGSIVALSDLGLQVDQMIGAGVAPIEVSTQSYAITDGAQFQRQRAGLRKLTLTGKPIDGTALADFHVTRRTLWDAFKPDRVTPQQPVRFLYYGAQGTQQIDAYYEKGLELGNMDGPMAEDVAIGFVAANPYWYTPVQQGTALAPRVSLGSTNYIAWRDGNGLWGTLGANGTTLQGAPTAVTPIQALAWQPSGTLILAGSWGTVGGTVQPAAAWYTPSNNRFGTFKPNLGGVNAIFEAVVVLPDESIIFGGTAAAPGTPSNILKYTSSTGSIGTIFSGIGSAFNGEIRSLLYSGQTGTLYVGGGFVTSPADRVAAWDGVSAKPVALAGTGPSDNGPFVSALAQGQSGTIYIGGRFGSMNGGGARSMGWWTTNGTFGTVPQGVQGGGTIVYALNVGSDQRVWVAGDFGTAGGQVANNAAVYNGVQLSPLGSGFPSGEMHAVKYMTNGNVLYGGTFAGTAGGVAMVDNVAVWTGATYITLDIDLPGTAVVSDVLQAPNGTTYLAYRTSGTAQVASVTTIVNSGRAAVYPTLRLRNLGTVNARLTQIVNTTTGAGVYFNMQMVGSEICTLVTQPGSRSFQSNIRANIFGNIQASSNLASFNLLPGTNQVSFFSEPNIEASFFWQPVGWAADSGTVL